MPIGSRRRAASGAPREAASECWDFTGQTQPRGRPPTAKRCVYVPPHAGCCATIQGARLKLADAMPITFASPAGLANVAHGLVIASLVIVFLHFASPIIEPLVIAALLSFILAPVMRRLRMWGIPRFVAALVCVIITLSAIGLLGTTLGLQVRQLAEDLPSYDSNLRAKIHLLGGRPLASSVLESFRHLSRPRKRTVSSHRTGDPPVGGATPPGRNQATRTKRFGVHRELG